MSLNIIFEPSSSAVAQIAQLSDMTMDEIKSLWRQLYRKEPPTHIRSFLEKCDAGHAYIASQRAKGWIPMTTLHFQVATWIALR